MKKDQLHRRGADPANSHRWFLLLAFLAGALLLRCWPPMNELAVDTERFLPLILLLPALLGGSPCGLWLIPTGSLMLGASAMRQLSGAECFSGALPAIVPLLIVTPLFFLTAVYGMKLSALCLQAASRGNTGKGSMLLPGQLLLWGVGLCAAVWKYSLR